MAAAGHAYAETTTDVLATDTVWVDAASIPASSFEANKKYLIIASATLKIASAADRAQARLVRGTTPTVFDDATLSGEMLNLTQEHQFDWMYVYTQGGTAELVKIQVASETTSDVTCTASQIFVLKLSDDFTENTDYFFTEDLVDYTATTTMTAKAAVTFTPNGTDRWLVIGHANWAVNALTGEIQADLYDGTTVHQQQFQEGEDINDQHAVNMFYCGVPTSGSKTFSVRLGVEVANEAVFVSNRIIAINLAKFAASASQMTAAEVQLATRPTWTNLGTLTCVPTVTGNWFYFGSVVNDVNATGTVNYRLQDDESGTLVSDPAYGDTAPQDDQWDPTDECIYTIFKMKSLSASRTVNYDGSNSAATTGRAQQRILGGFSLELFSSSTPKASSDSGAGTDVLALTVALPLTESGVGTDAQVLAAILALTESGAGTDNFVVTVPIAFTDSGAGTDSLAAPTAAISITETGAGTDALALSAALSLIESGLGTDLVALIASILHTDTGSGTDTLSLNTDGATFVAFSDSGLGTDAQVLIAQVSSQEAGSGTDTLAHIAALSSTDTGAGTDTAVPTRAPFSITDEGAGTEIFVPTRLIVLTEQGVVSDLLALTASVLASDAGSGVEALIMGAILAAVDSGTAVDIFAVQPDNLVFGVRVEVAEGGLTITALGNLSVLVEDASSTVD